jgi:hypothetical protein
MTRRRILLLGGVLAALAATAGALRPRGDGLDHVVDAAGLHGCAEVVRTRPTDVDAVRRWGRASATGDAECRMAGGYVAWARFPSETALARDLREHPAGDPVCVYGQEAVVDGLLIPPGPRELCRRLGGTMENGR